MAKNAHLVLDERATIEDSIVRLYVKIPSIPAASEVPVMNTEQHVQSANYSI